MSGSVRHALDHEICWLYDCNEGLLSFIHAR